jgi:hypothetical protein
LLAANRSGFEREPRFSDSARTDERHQALCSEEPLDIGEFRLAAVEARELERQVVTAELLLAGRCGFAAALAGERRLSPGRLFQPLPLGRSEIEGAS